MKTLSDIFKQSSLRHFSDYTTFGRNIEKLVLKGTLNVDKHLNVALLSSSTAQGIKESLVSQCSQFDIFPNVYIGNYGQYAQEIIDKNSSLYQSDPDLVIIYVDTQTLAGDYFFTPYEKTAEQIQLWVEETVDFLQMLVAQIIERTTSKVLLHNLETPYNSSLGIIENKKNYGFIESVEDINRLLRNRYKSSNQVYIYDYNAFCSRIGKENIIDFKMYYMGDIKLKPHLIPRLCADYAKYLQAMAGRTKKCIVLDLDNTLWGGVIGESGLEGIDLGPTPKGRSFLEFQKYLYALYSRGIILAVNSKNNFQDAIDVIRDHPHMMLREKHFAAIRINWDNKVANMKSLAKEMNIGLDSMVFIDDDELNRDMMCKFLPEVEVIKLPVDTSLYVKTLMETSLFDSLFLTDEDMLKGQMYHAEKKRQKLAETAIDISDYLRGLNIRVKFEHANINTIPRISQLTQKTNQFNLASKRYSEEHIVQLSTSDDHYVLTISLKDKFGDNGLTGVAIIEKKKDELYWQIDNFLLSCRILGRGAEDALLAYALTEARSAGMTKVTGQFIATKKNMPARDFYKNSGFIKTGEAGGIENWEFSLETEINFPNFIQCETL